jgi:hypothetical protein
VLSLSEMNCSSAAISLISGTTHRAFRGPA